ncbi:tripartite tricarboxylate transporter substrate binding protein [Ramlibacter sp. G-1-2-2]|uniref:Tripartite tricarboxylate transporter substrate binding protein n=1 Tax=Ramlibacter agri TaxID=2728837 RepID=A0A848H9N0_9BURK|nr:tripartite tricarboxylate transporter substrate binding protein [Ramlibacter agri]NML47475.1 tripartite tricarboxylate transporter substrate binding protein [Ramlibacter agri]
MNKRNLLACVALAASAMLSSAHAEDAYPSRPIKLVVGVAPGATTDAAARLVAEVLSKNLGTTIVDNQPGANGTIAARNVARAKPDGYTLLAFYSDQMQVAPLVYKNAYDPLEDFAFITTTVRSGGFILAVPESSPAKTFAEFIDYAKSGKKQMNYGTYGVGSSVQLGFEIFNERYGTKMLHIPYKGGGPSYQAAVAGEVDIVAGTSFIELLKANRLRPLAIGGSQHSPEFPNIPTLAGQGFGELVFGPVFYGVAAPRGTPPEIIEKVRAAVAKGAQNPEFAARLKPIAHDPFIVGPAETAALVRKGLDTYRPVVQKLKISLDN